MSRKWGKLTVLSFAGYAQNHRRTLWKCQCDCGKEVIVRSDCLRSTRTDGGRTTSCGCSRNGLGPNSKAWKGYEGLSASRWNRILRDAKQRNLPVEISIETAWDLLVSQNWKCAITGTTITLPLRTKGEEATASLDRIDSSKGYVEGNVQWVHKNVNRMKWDMNMSEFIDWCKKVVNHMSA